MLILPVLSQSPRLRQSTRDLPFALLDMRRQRKHFSLRWATRVLRNCWETFALVVLIKGSGLLSLIAHYLIKIPVDIGQPGVYSAFVLHSGLRDHARSSFKSCLCRL